MPSVEIILPHELIVLFALPLIGGSIPLSTRYTLPLRTIKRFVVGKPFPVLIFFTGADARGNALAYFRCLLLRKRQYLNGLNMLRELSRNQSRSDANRTWGAPVSTNAVPVFVLLLQCFINYHTISTCSAVNAGDAVLLMLRLSIQCPNVRRNYNGSSVFLLTLKLFCVNNGDFLLSISAGMNLVIRLIELPAALAVL